MAIDTFNEKLALIAIRQVWNPSIPYSTDGLGQDDKQHLLSEYPGILWGAGPGVTLAAQLRATHRRVFSRVFGRVN